MIGVLRGVSLVARLLKLDLPVELNTSEIQLYGGEWLYQILEQDTDFLINSVNSILTEFDITTYVITSLPPTFCVNLEYIEEFGDLRTPNSLILAQYQIKV